MTKAEKAATEIVVRLVGKDHKLFQQFSRYAERRIDRPLGEKDEEIAELYSCISILQGEKRLQYSEIKRLKQRIASIERLSNRCQFFFDQLKDIILEQKP